MLDLSIWGKTMFVEFLIEHWQLAAAWLVLLFLLLNHENRRGGKAVTPQQLSDMVNREDALVLDIRDSGEFRQGHIVNSLNIPLKDIDNRISELGTHKEKPVIVVCKIGQSATGITKQLKTNGFTSVYKLGGGLSEWTASNLPLVKQ